MRTPSFLPAARAAVLWAALALACAVPALAAAPQTHVQAPGCYRFQLGQFEITALFDGVSELDTQRLQGIKPVDLGRLLGRAFVDNPKMRTAVNAYLVNTGKELVLIDTGMGPHRGPALGHLVENLKAAGVDPDQVDVVLLTHLHPDHAGGLTDAGGKPVFPRAWVLAAAEEAGYWLSDAAMAAAPERVRQGGAFAAKMIAPYKAAGNWGTFAQGAEVVPGIRSVAAFGHTPGHTAYLLESEGQKLLVWGDVVHAHAVQFARPGVGIDFDSEPKAAVAMRLGMFKYAAEERCLVAGMHLPFPGLGHVREDGGGAYAWVPVEYAPLPPAAK
jgi:glyoxylase-like metal-dependent hydrolase (beta-lactamase superfamily II)